MNQRELEFIRCVDRLTVDDAIDIGNLIDILTQHRISQIVADVLVLPAPLITALGELADTLGFPDQTPLRELACGLVTFVESKRCRLKKLYSNKLDLVCILDTFTTVRIPFVFPGATLMCLRGEAIHELVHDGFAESYHMRTGDGYIAYFTSMGRLTIKPNTSLLISKLPALMEVRKRMFRFQRCDTEALKTTSD